MLLNGHREDGTELLEASIAKMEHAGLQAWIIDPFRRALPRDG